MRIMRELSREDCNTFCKGATFILLHVPIREVDFFKEAFHPFRVIWKITLIDKSWIPFEQDVAVIEDDGFYRRGHSLILAGILYRSGDAPCAEDGAGVILKAPPGTASRHASGRDGGLS